MQRQLEAMVADLARGVPSIVCMHYDRSPGAPEHFRLVLGYDCATNEIIFHEPAQDQGAYKRMASARFLELWPLKYERDHLDGHPLCARAGPDGRRRRGHLPVA